MKYIVTELFVPGWAVWLIAVSAVILVISLLLLSKKLGGLEEKAEKFKENKNHHSLRKPGFRLPD